MTINAQGAARLNRVLVSMLMMMPVACASDGSDEGLGHVGSGELAVTLAGVDRCEAGRFESTVAAACTAAVAPRRMDAAPLGGAWGPEIAKGRAYGVRLPAEGTGHFAGELLLAALTAGEYVVYLGTPNVELEVVGLDGVAVSPVCGRYLPLAERPPSYPGDCTLRGAYAFNLSAGTYRLRLGPVGTSYVRVAVLQRREAGATIAEEFVCGDEALESTLASACAVAPSTTPLTASVFGGEAPGVIPSSAYGVRLRAVGDANEGAVRFTPEYTADYAVYTGTPYVPVALLGGEGQVANACARHIDDAAAQQIIGDTCAELRAGYVFRRLEGGVPQELELGPISPQSWVRTIVLPTAPDSDDDGLADNLDRCPDLAGDPTTCGCAPEVCAGGALWTRRIEENRQDSGRAVATDAQGNIYVVGETEIDETVITISVRKFDSAGAQLWMRTLDYSDFSEGTAVAVDPAGNVIVGGAYYNDDNAGSDFDQLVVKLDPEGNVLWSNTLDSGVWDHTGAVTTDGEGHVVLVGRSRSAEAGGLVLPVVHKFDGSGTLLWSRSYTDGSSTGGDASAVTTDSTGASIVTGWLQRSNTQRAFLAKYDAAGSLVWARVDETGELQWGEGVAVDSAGDIVFAASRRGAMNSDIWLEKLTSSGSPLWAEIYDGDVDWAAGVAVDVNDHIAVTGTTRRGTEDEIWVRKYDGSGVTLWSHRYTEDSAQSYGVDVDASGHVVVVGSVSSPTDRGAVLIRYAP